jgi:sialidase-1
MKIKLHTLLILLINHFAIAQTETLVFQKGEEGYACFRIPAIVKAPNGELLAFCEARKVSCSDHGDVRIVMKRSTDNGVSWTILQTVVANGNNQAGNPAPVFDMFDTKYKKGRLFLLYNTGTVSEKEVREGKAIREIWYKTSVDNGKTWSESTNITPSVSKPNKPSVNPAYTFKEDWRSYANTPGHALQLTRGQHKGRIFVPANHSESVPQSQFRDYVAHGFYSDNHGATWQLSPNVTYEGSNESTAAELNNGGILMNIRNQSGDDRHRIMAFSQSAGDEWDDVYIEKQLTDPVCEGSMINYTTKNGQNLLLFSNLDHLTKRENLTLKYSVDNGKSWQLGKTIYAGSAAYSDLVIQKDNSIGVLYEKDDYTKIVYTTVREAELFETKPKPHLNVMTFNIRYATMSDSANAWLYRKDKAASQILFHDTHILGVQEALYGQITDLIERMPQFKYVGVGRDDGKFKGEFSAILYDAARLNVLAHYTFWLSQTPSVVGSKSWDAAITRIVTWAQMKDRLTNQVFYVFNTHFDHIGKEARRESAKMLLESVRAIAGDMPAIIMGDFNAHPDDEPIQVVMDKTNPKSLLDTKDLSQTPHFGPTGTFNGFKSKETHEQPIDYIFINKKMTVLQHATLSQTWGGLFSSDHFPVFVRLVLP